MQLPSALRTRLAGAPGAAEPLPVERDPAAGAAPFRFAARLVRFPREHEFFEDGDVQRHLYLQDVLSQVAEAPDRPRRAFPSGHLLDAHILEWHDSLFQILSERQDMYQCLVEGCTEKFKTSKARKDHLVRLHLYPADFRFDKPQKGSGPATPGASRHTAIKALGDDREQSEGEAMEVCSEPAAPSPAPAGGRWTYSQRIPSTICFGQGASRGFKSTKKRNKHR
ncbi:PREDICTED: zinc finger protein 511 isoform X1 [Propithecus coquereli]|uniref:zinc finger protein 511 isoform X1 n=1 Tax=Propithecus coquereli TaxID=379532 RepID=UPI00063F45B3|nr:PREDICTED: zinc finger protein 511 isoform X1 [Propithecus coquereli]